MKKVFAFVMTAALMLIGLQAFAQDIILKTDNSIIRANIEEINGDNIVYHNYDNPDGPVYKLPISQVQRVQFKNGTEQAFNTASAVSVNYAAPQAVPAAPAYSGFNPNQKLTRRGANLFLGNYELNDDEIRQVIGQDLWEETFSGARGQYGFAQAMELVGDVFLGVGLGGNIWLLTSGWGSSVGWTLFFIGYSGALTFYSIGLPFAAIANGRMNWVVQEANHRRGLAFEPTFNLGLAPHGVGLTVTF